MHSVSLLYFWFNIWCLFFSCVCCIWLFVLHRVSEREAALESALLMLQEFYLDLEKFLAWLTEAETTANVLQDATRKEKTLEDPQMVRELMKQWQVSQVLQFRGMSNRHFFPPVCAATQQNQNCTGKKKKNLTATNPSVLLCCRDLRSVTLILSDIFQHILNLKWCLEVQIRKETLLKWVLSLVFYLIKMNYSAKLQSWTEQMTEMRVC